MSRVRLFGSLISFDGIVFASYNLLTWANSSCVNQQLFCFLALLEFTHSFLVSSTRLPLDEKFDLLISFEIQVILFQAPCVLNDKFFTSMFHLQQVLKRPYGPPMEMVSGNTGAVAFEPASPSSPRPAPPFNATKPRNYITAGARRSEDLGNSHHDLCGERRGA